MLLFNVVEMSEEINTDLKKHFFKLILNFIYFLIILNPAVWTCASL